ncbi:MAG: PLP-dependent transferase [Muribaculum sp.]|nr:PLP-dependent transferase [Muribaculum sp.]
MHEIFKIRQNVWHVQDAEDVFFTIITGTRLAIVVDSGYGKADHRTFVEELVSTPYLVINSHGHPDHVGGNGRYDEVFIHPADLDMAKQNASRQEQYPILLPLSGEEEYDLGGIHVKVITLPGHTKGTVGFLLEEHGLLLSGDAFNPDMWMFAENHDTLDTLEKTLEKALSLPFQTYLGSHTTKEVPQPFLNEVLANVRERNIDWTSWQNILGRDTYELCHSGEYGVSRIRIDQEEALRIQATKERGFHTRLLHGAKDAEFPGGATLPPLFQVSAFSHENAQEIADIFSKKKAGYNYSRISNPTVRCFEERMTDLEQGVLSVAFASGMAAITGTLMNGLCAGDSFVSANGLYGGTIELFKGLERFGIHVKYAPTDNLCAIEEQITPDVRLLFAETISNPGLRVADIGKLSEIAHRHGIPLVIDNTMATACLARPLELGADIVINSSSKYINGSGSGISGVVTDGGKFAWDPKRFPALAPFLDNPGGLPPFAVRLRADLLCNYGACLSPQNAFLNLLGMETLALRLERECSNALALAKYFRTIPGITVNYPGLEECPGYENAKKILKGGYGAVLTVRFGSKERAFRVMDALRIPKIVSNIGDNRTLVIHPASTMALHSSDREKEDAGVYDDLVRISMGIENIADIISDFDYALRASSAPNT